MALRSVPEGSRRRRRHSAAARFTLVALVSVSTLLLSGRVEHAPVSPAAARAEAAAGQRLSLGGPALPPDARYDLLTGAESVPAPGLVARVRLPSVGIDAEVRPVGIVFRDGRLQYDIPTFEAGQYAGTAAPGAPGNVVIGGHVTLRNGAGVFRALPAVTVGAPIEVVTAAGTFRYRVTEVRVVAPDATEVMGHTPDATLTLITCTDDASHAGRVVVVGKLI